MEKLSCLNCGAVLNGPFCASCGQRAVPPNPTMAELTGDAWQELSGYDGRILATVRGLLRPGQLTQDYLSGRRAHYLPPLRVYVTVSVLYFVIAAAAPTTVGEINGRQIRAGSFRVEVTGQAPGGGLTDEDREQLRADLAAAPRLLRPMLEAMIDDPVAFRARVFATMPRVMFGMLPVFAALVSLFYRGRTFPAALVFAAHLHSVAFVVLAVSELAKFTNSIVVAVGIGMLAMIGLLVYALMAFRRVYGGGWPAVIGKTAVIGLVYALASAPAFFMMLMWVAW
jgi:hypothetical protein